MVRPNPMISQFWRDRAAGQPLGPWWQLNNPDVRLKVYQGGDDLTLEEYVKLPASVRRVLERAAYERSVG